MLFRLECKKIVFSIPFIIYCILCVIFTGSQYFPDAESRIYTEETDYKISGDHDLIMEGAVNSLLSEYTSNNYVCYPFGFYKAVHLKESKQEKITEYLKEMTGTNDTGLAEIQDGGEKEYYGMSDIPEYRFSTVTMADNFSYDRFLEIMTDVDDMLGGGSNYDPESLAAIFSRVEMTKEEAAAEYRSFIEEDKVTGGLARYFSDYAGIDLALLPVFVAAALTAADRKRRMQELVYTRNISSFRLVFTRYTALVFTMFVPVVIEMLAALIQAASIYSDETISYSAMFTIPTIWLLPILMFTTALGMLITEIFSSPAAVFVQIAVWFKAVMSGSFMLYGQISKFGLVCRHNTEMHRSEFMMNYDNFIFSRVFWTVMSLIAVIITVFVYNAKRGGNFNGIKLFGEGGILRRKA